MDVSPIPSTPLSGVSVARKWNFDSSVIVAPESFDIKRKLFEDDERDGESGAEQQKQWSPSSGYFSRSVNEESESSGSSQTNSFNEGSPSSKQETSNVYLTNSSPCKRPTTSPSACTTSPPIIKRQRLFSPASPMTPDEFPSQLRSPVRPTSSPDLAFNSSSDAATSFNEMVAPGDSEGDPMVDTPLRLARLRLDGANAKLTEATPSRSHSLQPVLPDTYQSSDVNKYSRSQSRVFVKSSGKRRCGGTQLTRRGSRGANINPFTPTELQSRARRMLHPGDANMESAAAGTQQAKALKKLTLRERNVSRYKEEFHEVCVIGSGSFGTVYKCINRLDGCVYALKRSHKPVAGSCDEPAALREVCAHAALGHPNIVRYYSAWAEEDYMIIQNEFCDGGNLATRIQENLRSGRMFGEAELTRLLRHVAMGLQYIHSLDLVHLDIKPDNIFLTTVRDSPHSSFNESLFGDSTHPSDGLSDSDDWSGQFIYKIGDMGLVTSTSDPEVEEGDCRYMPREILLEDFSQLCKADIFSLGLTVFQTGSGLDLPKNGGEWHNLRNGGMPQLQSCSPDFNNLLQLMVHNDPSKRPTASELISTQKTKAQLYRELNEEKIKNELLRKELLLARGQNSSVGTSQTVKSYNL